MMRLFFLISLLFFVTSCLEEPSNLGQCNPNATLRVRFEQRYQPLPQFRDGWIPFAQAQPTALAQNNYNVSVEFYDNLGKSLNTDSQQIPHLESPFVSLTQFQMNTLGQQLFIENDPYVESERKLARADVALVSSLGSEFTESFAIQTNRKERNESLEEFKSTDQLRFCSKQMNFYLLSGPEAISDKTLIRELLIQLETHPTE